jgi:probable selenium-dependent hydroxylase accessory protein YqeC
MRGERSVQTNFLTQNEDIAKAFGILPGITAIVGGGGKTTLMLSLARALSRSGARVIVTTTTHIFPPEDIATTDPESEQAAKSALARNNLVCFASPAEGGKLAAPKLSTSTMRTIADYVLVEADGAKRLPLKAPAEHEPVIPAAAELVIAVAGLDGIGQAIAEAAFRPARYAVLCGKMETDAVTPIDAARVLAHENGQRKGVPANARFAVLLNKADDETRRNIALEIAAELGRYHVERVVIAALNRN